MDIFTIALQLFVILFAITVHEASHGWAANKMGDPTAKIMGRVTLNPVAHIDPIGTVLFPVMLVIMGVPPFGWAKPVPVNPMNLRNPRRDNLLISAAGPLSNISVAILAFFGILVLNRAGLLNLGSGLFQIFYYTVLINVILAIFNLIPIPPLDGSGVLMGLISEGAAQKYEQIRPYGFIILILLIMTGFLRLIFGFIIGIVNMFIRIIILS